MYVLGDTWSDGFLDYHRSDGELRIRVRCWQPVARLEDVFVVQPRSLRRVWNYVREVGVANVARKIRSRLRETLRNRRVVAIGAGEVLETCDARAFPVGAAVAFVAPCHPECVERVVLPPACVRAIPAADLQRWTSHGGIRLMPMIDPPADVHADHIAGWSIHSGIDPAGRATALLDWAARRWSNGSPGTPPSKEQRASPLAVAGERLLELPGPSESTERRGRAPAIGNPQLSAVVFGLGHYAKTCILPNLDARIRVASIHELEPTQIGKVAPASDVLFDTCPVPRPEERHDIFFIAGYHHTHAPIAVEALRRGAWAVIEKPLVTTRAELVDLLNAARDCPGRVFGAFHMRYNPLWDCAREDLRLTPGAPVNYHCVVFEIKLGRLHWYNWPNSRSRIVSNGCHWLDHFLFMNDFSAPVRRDAWKAANGDVHVSVELANGASFSMSLTDIGSPRIGVQEHVQLRAGDVTVRVDNGGRYVSEDRSRIIRRRRVNKATFYRRMYGTICRRILAGEAGDSVESIQRSCELMLDLEDQMQADG